MKLQTLKPRLQQLPRLLTPLLTESKRLSGRRAVERRARWLRLHPLCWACELEDRTTAADVVDHDLPLWAGGADEERNFGSLCQVPHHDAKTACEAAMRATGTFNLAMCTCGLHGRNPRIP